MVLVLGAVPQCNFPAGLLLTDCLCSPNGPPSVLHLVVQDQVQSSHHCSLKQPTMFHIVPLFCVLHCSLRCFILGHLHPAGFLTHGAARHRLHAAMRPNRKRKRLHLLPQLFHFKITSDRREEIKQSVSVGSFQPDKLLLFTRMKNLELKKSTRNISQLTYSFLLLGNLTSWSLWSSQPPRIRPSIVGSGLLDGDRSE